MTAFDNCLSIEERGKAVLMPFLKQVSKDRYVMNDGGRLAKYLQRSAGDVQYNDGTGELISVDFKIEVRHTGRLFLELWSNRNLNSEDDHLDRGSKPGWLVELHHCSRLWYYFLDTDDLYIARFLRLKRWAFGFVDKKGVAHPGNIYRYPEVTQGKHRQMNDTVGRLVPVVDLQRAIGMVHVNPKQIPLFEEML